MVRKGQRSAQRPIDAAEFNPGGELTLDVDDARGRRFKAENVTLNDFGSIRSHLLLPDSVVQADNRIHLHRKSDGESDKIGALSLETTFKVTEYKLEAVELDFEFEKLINFRCEKSKTPSRFDITTERHWPTKRSSIEYAVTENSSKGRRIRMARWRSNSKRGDSPNHRWS